MDSRTVDKVGTRPLVRRNAPLSEQGAGRAFQKLEWNVVLPQARASFPSLALVENRIHAPIVWQRINKVGSCSSYEISINHKLKGDSKPTANVTIGAAYNDAIVTNL
jgi:hypothetical protein